MENVETERKKPMFFILAEVVCVMFLLVSCLSGRGETSSMVDKGDRGKMDSISADGYDYTKDLTAERKALIRAISIDEKAVDAGQLADWQIEVLRQLIFAEEILKERYPSYSFTFDAIMPKDAVRKITVISFTEDSEPDVFYKLELHSGESEGAVYTELDNFWKKVLKHPYEEAIKAYLKGEGIACDEVDVTLSGMNGIEFCEGMNPKLILDGTYRVTQTVSIGVNAENLPISEYDLYGSKVQESIERLKLYGYFETIVYDEEEGRVDLFRYHFDTFQFR